MKEKIKSNIVKIILWHLGFVAFIISIIWLYDLTDIGCPIRKLTGVPCPTCGMTRAMLSLLRFDFRAYITYNPAAVPVIVAIWLAFHKRLFSNIKLIDIIIIAIAVFTFVLYIIKNFVI